MTIVSQSNSIEDGFRRLGMRRRDRLKEKLRRVRGSSRPSGRQSIFQHGEMRLALLSLISEEPRHGYDLMNTLEVRTGGMYRPSPGAVYPTLQHFQDEGLVTAAKKQDKVLYTVTSKGQERVEEELDRLDIIWARVDELADWGPRDDPAALEIARPLERLSKAAHKAVTRRDVDPELVRDVLKRAKNEIKAFEDGQTEDD
jgi:DNA-binding PadR family transcriptional regulator